MMRVLPSLLAVEAMRRGAEPREAAREVKLMVTVQCTVQYSIYIQKEVGGKWEQINKIIKTLDRVLLLKTNFCLPTLSTLKFFYIKNF
jgi:hypothetical protein